MKNIQKSLQVAFQKDYFVGRWYNYKSNWGDAINPILIENLFGKKIFHQNEIINFSRQPIISTVGSIINVFPNNDNILIWGSGVANPQKMMNYIPKKLFAVRGPKTWEYLKQQQIEAPRIFGDPVLLINKIYQPKEIFKNYKLGIIRHYEDQIPELDHLISNNKEIKSIEILRNMDNPFEIIDEILSCEKIISSSLHGLILADVYKVPNSWVFFEGFEKSEFKFQDYYESINQRNKTASIIKEISYQNFENLPFEIHEINLDLPLLFNSNPFNT